MHPIPGGAGIFDGCGIFQSLFYHLHSGVRAGFEPATPFLPLRNTFAVQVTNMTVSFYVLYLLSYLTPIGWAGFEPAIT